MNPAPQPGTLPLLEMERVFDAPRDLVWRSWTEAERIAEWFGHTDQHEVLVHEMSVEVGGGYRFEIVNAEGQRFIVAGTYREIEPQGRLVFTWAWQNLGEFPETTVVLTLEEEGTQTRLKLAHAGLPDTDQGRHHEEGWNACFDSFVRKVASRS